MKDSSEKGVFERPFPDEFEIECAEPLGDSGMECGAMARVEIGDMPLCWDHAEAAALALRHRYTIMVDRIRAFKKGEEPK